MKRSFAAWPEGRRYQRLLEQLRRCRQTILDQDRVIEAARHELLQSEKMAALGRLVAGFAHEINTPIGVAVGAITNSQETLGGIERLLAAEEVSEDDLRAALQTLRQGDELAMANLRRAARLVQAFKRTSIDQASDELRLFSLRQLVDDVLDALHNQLKRLPVSIVVDCPEGLEIRGAPGLLEQLLTNLLLNSVIHGFDNGARAGEIRIAWSVNGASLRLDYADSGKGMAREVVDRIFQPFFTTRRAEGGSGLGMYICHTIVTTQLNGTIQCDSQPDKGVHFLVEFPAEIREK